MGQNSTGAPSSTGELSASKLLSTEELFEGLDKIYESIEPSETPSEAGALEPTEAKPGSALFRSAHLEITDSGDAFNVRAEIPEASARELRMAAGQRHLPPNINQINQVVGRPSGTGSRKRRADPILRTVDLLADADREKVTATLKGGTLEVRLPKGRVKTAPDRPAV